MARIYRVTFEKVTVSAVQDLFQIIGATGKMCLVQKFSLSDVDATLPTAQMMALRVRHLGLTVTNGSGGTSPTPIANPGDAAASFTAKANSTTPATTNGTATIFLEDGSHLSAGYEHDFADSAPEVGPSQSAVIELITAPTANWVLSGTVWVKEYGG